MTWQMAYQTLTKLFGNSVAEFDYTRLSCQDFSRSGFQAGMLFFFYISNVFFFFNQRTVHENSTDTTMKTYKVRRIDIDTSH